jgi:hypothetical protein
VDCLIKTRVVAHYWRLSSCKNDPEIVGQAKINAFFRGFDPAYLALLLTKAGRRRREVGLRLLGFPVLSAMRILGFKVVFASASCGNWARSCAGSNGKDFERFIETARR